MPPLKRTATGPPASPAPKRVRATPLKGERSSREPAEGNETPTDTRASRGIRTRRQLLENPDSESGSSDAEDEGTDEEEHIESKNDCDRFLVEFDPEHLAQCVAQARAEVKSFLSAPHPGDAKTRQALNGLFSDVIRGESNSVMLLGPHGSGKTSAIDAAIAEAAAQKPIHVVRLHSTLHPNDKIAVRELVRQLVSLGALAELYVQDLADFDDEVEPVSGQAEEEEEDALSSEDDLPLSSDDEEPPVQVKLRRKRREAREAAAKKAAEDSILVSVSTATAHLLSLLARPPDEERPKDRTSSNQARSPIVIILDNLDEFAMRPKQALLYVLLDAVQASSYPPGLFVVATSTRGDALDLLEKRVKSRFSHRVVHMRPPPNLEAYTALVQKSLELKPKSIPCASAPGSREESTLHTGDSYGPSTPTVWNSFVQAWNARVAQAVNQIHVQALLAHQMETSCAMRSLGQALIRAMALLPVNSLLTAGVLARALVLGDVRAQEALLRSLSAQECTLLATAFRVAYMRGQETFTLAMLRAEMASLLPPQRDRQRTTSKLGLANPANLLEAFQSLLSLGILIPAVVAQNLVEPPELASKWISPVVAGGARGRRAGPTPITFLPTRLAVLPRDVIATLSDVSRPVPLDQRLVKWAQHKAE